MCWIAFRQVREREDTNETLDFMYRWLDSDVGATLEALEARAAPEPYYLVQPLSHDGQPWDRRSYVHRAFSPQAPKLLRAIRAKARKREGRLVTFAQLAKELRSEVTRKTREEEQIDHAQKEMVETVRASRLTVWARRYVKREMSIGVHEPVPVSIFMNDMVTITHWGKIGAAPHHATAILSYHDPEYREATFKTAQVLELWPPALLKSEYENSIGSYPDKVVTQARKFGESCILTDAIARLVYGSNYDGRYYAAPGNHHEETEARHRRKLDVLYPTVSGLPNVPKRGQMGSIRYDIAMTLWAHEAATRWKKCEDRLHAALVAGSIKAFDANGQAVPAEFWLANNCRNPETYRFRLKGKDIAGLGAVLVNATFTASVCVQTGLTPNALPADMASDPKAVAAYDVMVAYARERLASQRTREKRDALAQVVSRKTGYPVGKARNLYRHLPVDLKNPPRKALS
jgi:hypothetical protein